MENDPDLLIMCSRNGVGKTSVLEACALITLVLMEEISGKNLPKSLIHNGAKQCTIVGTFCSGTKTTEVRLVIDRGNPEDYKTINEILQDSKTINEILRPQEHHEGLLYFHSDRQWDKLFTGMGSGEKAMNSIYLALARQMWGPPSIILIDEPELHLNTELHGAFIRGILGVIGDTQVIVVTHSQDIGRCAEGNQLMMLFKEIKCRKTNIRRKSQVVQRKNFCGKHGQRFAHACGRSTQADGGRK